MTAVLRAWRRSDAGALSSAFRADPALAVQVGGADLSTTDDAAAYLASTLADPDAAPPQDGTDRAPQRPSALPRTRSWAIDDDGLAVGSVTLSAIESRHGTAWASYWVAPSARGRGLAASALAAASAWAFDAGLFRLELGHRVNNPASCRVAGRAGYLVEGIERGKLRYGAERFDVELHARLATDPDATAQALHLV